MRMYRGLRKLASLAITGALSGVWAAGAAADPVPPGADWSERWVRSSDGTRLHADVFRPKGIGRQKTPVILIVSPYIAIGSATNGFLDQPQILDQYEAIFERAFDRGYSVVQVAFRGHGSSEGCPDLGGRGEQADAKAAVRWAATRPWSTGEVGGWGLSYDGYGQIMNLAQSVDGLEAAIVEGPVTDLHRAYYMRGVPYMRGTISSGTYYGLLATVPPLPANATPEAVREAAAAAAPPECVAQVARLNRGVANPDPRSGFWRKRNLIPAASKTQIPVLWTQGFYDEQIYGDSFLPVWNRLRGPHRAWFGQFPHVVAGEAENGRPSAVGRSGFIAQAFRWLDRHVRGLSRRNAAPRPGNRVALQEGSTGLWRGERDWPPDDSARYEVMLHPGSYVDASPNQAEAFCLRVELHCLPGLPGVLASWTVTQKLPYAAHFAGVPRVNVDVATPLAGAHLIGVLYDIAPNYLTTLISRGAIKLGGNGTYRFHLYPQDWRFEAGHRIALAIAGTDAGFFTPGPRLTRVEIEGGSLSLPFLEHRRRFDLDGGPSDTVAGRTKFPFAPPFIPRWEVDAQLPPPMKPPR